MSSHTKGATLVVYDAKNVIVQICDLKSQNQFKGDSPITTATLFIFKFCFEVDVMC